jgi:Ran GTPase-activating protein 1
MAAWAKAFAAHRGIKEVKMTQNGIRPEGIEVLLRHGLKHATGLRILDLQDNTFTLQGATALAEVVPEWRHLTDLGVGDCLLKKRGSILLFKALQKGSTPSLQALRLAFNDIDVTGLNELKQAITGSLLILRRVELNGNRFSEAEPSVEDIRDLLLDRLKVLGGGAAGEEGEEDFGPVMDELEDMDEESESESEEELEAVEEEAERVVEDDQRAEEEEVAEEKDERVDELARKLGQAAI